MPIAGLSPFKNLLAIKAGKADRVEAAVPNRANLEGRDRSKTQSTRLRQSQHFVPNPFNHLTPKSTQNT